MRVVAVPCLKDNYAYLVIDGRRAAVVDPGAAGLVETAAHREQVDLVAIWLTHHHHDHVGGVEALVAAFPKLQVIAHVRDKDRAPRLTRVVDDGDTVTMGNVTARIIHNPGHTLGAISYLVDDAVFTGDTMFGAGCGRLFEGTAEMMHASLSRLSALPSATRVYFGHEYTRANLAFAAAVEPHNHSIAARAASFDAMSAPSTIHDEHTTNPFLRVTEPAVISAAVARGARPDPVSVFAELRSWKDTFKA